MSVYPTVLQKETAIHRAEDEALNAVFRAERTDAQLVGLILAGDQTAFESLFDRHKRLVGSIAARYFRQPEQIEEIIQIAFAKTYVELPRFRGTFDMSFVSWLARITSNACLDVLRTQKRRPEDLLDDLDTSEALLCEAVIHRSSEDLLIDRDLAEKLLSHLADDDRALMQMLYVEDMGVAEAARQLGWSASKIKIRAWRAKNSLRRILKRYL
jgi:RNA polymerase sigma-70 factor, ECF subfamily